MDGLSHDRRHIAGDGAETSLIFAALVRYNMDSRPWLDCHRSILQSGGTDADDWPYDSSVVDAIA
jgi:hypothetical protein